MLASLISNPGAPMGLASALGHRAGSLSGGPGSRRPSYARSTTPDHRASFSGAPGERVYAGSRVPSRDWGLPTLGQFQFGGDPEEESPTPPPQAPLPVQKPKPLRSRLLTFDPVPRMIPLRQVPGSDPPSALTSALGGPIVSPVVANVYGDFLE
jgi:hypothetical protein